MNYLVGAVFDRNQFEYMDAYQISRRSYKDNLAGEWEELLVAGDYPKPMIPYGWAEMHKDILKRIRDLVKAGNNVLYAEVDTVCAAPIEVFGQYQDMMMFWLTCATNDAFERYMNSGVIYFPSTAQPKIWEVLEDRLNDYDGAVWDNFQVVTNAMYWAQDPAPKMVPELNWSPYVANPLPKESAKILHFHSSRGVNQMLEAMREQMCRH